MMVADNMRVALVTAHIPLQKVPATLSRDLVRFRLDQLSKSLEIDFGISKPVIAVLGLNPHAGENGHLGKEEEEIIRPAIVESKKSGNLTMGPYPADGFFGSMQFKNSMRSWRCITIRDSHRLKWYTSRMA